MADLDELDLRPEGAPPGPDGAQDRSFRLVLAGVVAAAALLTLGGYAFWRATQRPPATPAAAAGAPTPTPVPDPAAVGLPPLDQSDAFVREQAQGLAPHPLLGLWLGQQEIIRLVVNVVETVGKGESPRRVLGFLAPKGEFQVEQRKDRVVIADASYARYDFFAEGVGSLDAAAGARLFRRALPLLEAAYRELGYPQGGFEAAFREGVAHLLAVPVVETEIAVEPVRRGSVLVHACADPGLEALSPAQKHLLRMGAANVGRIQATLRALDSALGP